MDLVSTHGMSSDDISDEELGIIMSTGGSKWAWWLDPVGAILVNGFANSCDFEIQFNPRRSQTLWSPRGRTQFTSSSRYDSPTSYSGLAQVMPAACW